MNLDVFTCFIAIFLFYSALTLFCLLSVRHYVLGIDGYDVVPAPVQLTIKERYMGKKIKL